MRPWIPDEQAWIEAWASSDQEPAVTFDGVLSISVSGMTSAQTVSFSSPQQVTVEEVRAMVDEMFAARQPRWKFWKRRG